MRKLILSLLLLSACADASLDQSTGIQVLHREWAACNGMPDVRAPSPWPPVVPARYDHEPARWSLRLVDDGYLQTLCPPAPAYRGRAHTNACSIVVGAYCTIRISRDLATPEIEAIAAAHAPPPIVFPVP